MTSMQSITAEVGARERLDGGAATVGIAREPRFEGRGAERLVPRARIVCARPDEVTQRPYRARFTRLKSTPGIIECKWLCG